MPDAAGKPVGMISEQDLADFLQSTFRSVWSLETLLLMMRDPSHCWSNGELLAALRASDLVIRQSVDQLSAAGLIVPEQDCVRYQPASEDLSALASAAEAYYARSPAAVRRLIITARQSSLSAFSDAFRFRKGDS